MFKIETSYEDGHQKLRIILDPEIKDYLNAARILLGEEVSDTSENEDAALEEN